MTSLPNRDTVRFVTLDVFTNERFKGNPLAIVEIPHGGDLGQELKQRIAREFKLSETVFLHPPLTEGELFNRRYDIFTLTQELPFAGHPTIGTIVYLCHERGTAVQSLTLQTKAGPIHADYDPKTGIAKANIPHDVRIHQSAVPFQSILEAQPTFKAIQPRDSSPLVSIVRGMTFILINLPQVSDLANLTTSGPRIDPDAIQPDAGWESFTAPYYYAIVLEDEATRRLRIRSRMMEPSVGEDPATGVSDFRYLKLPNKAIWNDECLKREYLLMSNVVQSAASALAAFLALQRGAGGASYAFDVEQGVEMGRRSEIGVEVTLDAGGECVESVVLAGEAVLVSEGDLYV
ncbi:MAG: hypothetical protein Q9184_003273 [Pyrenodesmia sp. 2 TL-2023]